MSGVDDVIIRVLLPFAVGIGIGALLGAAMRAYKVAISSVHGD